MKNKKSNVRSRWLIKGSAMVTTIVIFAVVSMVYLSVTNISMDPRNWTALGADADPGNGNCGLCNIFIYPHAADPATTYGSNITEGNSYAYSNALNTTLTGYVPHSTTFDIVIKYQFNTTTAKCSTNATWMMSWVNSTIRCPGLSINANATMSEVNVTATPNQMWVQFYVNNGGSGYTITHGQEINVTHYTPYAYW